MAAELHDAGYRIPNVNVDHVNGGAQLHVTPTELLFTALTGTLPGGPKTVRDPRSTRGSWRPTPMDPRSVKG